MRRYIMGAIVILLLSTGVGWANLISTNSGFENFTSAATISNASPPAAFSPWQWVAGTGYIQPYTSGQMTNDSPDGGTYYAQFTNSAEAVWRVPVSTVLGQQYEVDLFWGHTYTHTGSDELAAYFGTNGNATDTKFLSIDTSIPAASSTTWYHAYSNVTDSYSSVNNVTLTGTGGTEYVTIAAKASGWDVCFDAVTVNPVPEPSTLAPLAAGMVGLLCYAWRKRR